MLLHLVGWEGRLDPGEVQRGQQIEKGFELLEAGVFLRDIEHQTAHRSYQVAQVSQILPYSVRLVPPRLDADLEVAKATLEQRHDLRLDTRWRVFEGIDSCVGGKAVVTRAS